MKIFEQLENFTAKWWGLFALASLPFFIVFWPVLFGGQIFANSDGVSWLYPFFDFYDNALMTSQSFFWNPFNFGGFPSFVTATGGFFSQLGFLFVKLLPAFSAYNWLLFLYWTLAVFFTGLFLKTYGLSVWAQLIGGWAFAFSQWNWAYDLPLVTGFAILPLMFLIARKLAQTPNWKWILAGVITSANMFLAAHFNLILIILTTNSVFILFSIFDNKLTTKIKSLVYYVLSITLGGLVGLIQLVPSYRISGFSGRQALSYEAASTGALEFLDFTRLILPHFRFPDFASAETLMYMGVLPLVFTLLVLFRKSKTIKFFSWVFIISLIISIQYSPLFWLMQKLPIFDLFRSPSRWMIAGFFSASILSAFGLDYFIELSKNRWFGFIKGLLKWGSMVLVAGSTVVTVVIWRLKEQILDFLNRYFERNIFESTSGLPLEHYQKVIEDMFNSDGQLINPLKPEVYVPLLFLLVAWYVIKNFSKSFALTVVFLNFVLVFYGFHPTIPSRVVARGSEISEYLQENSGRYFSFLPGFSEYQLLTVPYQPDTLDLIEFQKALLPPNFNLYYELESADYYDNLQPRRMARLLALLGSDRATMGAKLSEEDIPLEEKIDKFESRKYLLDLLGIRYVISAYPLDESVFRKVLETRATRFEIPVYLYENKDYRPTVYLADKASAMSVDEEKSYEAVFSQKPGDRDVLIECELDCPETQGQAQGSAEVLKTGDGYWEIAVNTQDTRWLVVSENYLPGWQALLDDQLVDINYINSVFMGVVIPPGEHEVVLEYHYPFFGK